MADDISRTLDSVYSKRRTPMPTTASTATATILWQTTTKKHMFSASSWVVPTTPKMHLSFRKSRMHSARHEPYTPPKKDRNNHHTCNTYTQRPPSCFARRNWAQTCPWPPFAHVASAFVCISGSLIYSLTCFLRCESVPNRSSRSLSLFSKSGI